MPPSLGGALVAGFVLANAITGLAQTVPNPPDPCGGLRLLSAHRAFPNRKSIAHLESGIAKEKTVFIIDQGLGRHQGEIYRIRKDGESWLSVFQTAQKAPQGNPLWMVRALGPQAASYFSFAVITDSEAWVPSGRELSAAIDRFNEGLNSQNERIPIRYYDAEQNKSLAESYLEAFALRAELPVSSDPTTRMHDLSWHTSGIFLPQNLVQHAQRQSLAVLDFVATLKKKHPSWRRHKVLRYFIPTLIQHRADLIDYGTANTIFGLASQSKSAENYNFQTAFYELVGGGNKQTGENLQRSQALSAQQYLELEISRIGGEIAKKKKSEIEPHAFLVAELENFIAQAKDPKLSEVPEFTATDFCSALAGRIRWIQERAAALGLQTAP
jgi:hypothetical protein